jgi:hypothetical protein
LVTDQYAITGSNWNGSWPVYSTLGFNSAFQLNAQLVDAPVIGVTKNMPEAANHVTQLATSESHTETVGLSATSGIQNGNGLGTIGASWSESWTWGQTSTISFSDWEADSTLDISDNSASYDFFAFGGSDVTAAVLTDNLLQLPPSNEQIFNQQHYPFFYYPPTPPGFPAFNQLQTSAMTTQSETTWDTGAGNLVPPQRIELVSTADIQSGELLELTSAFINPFKRNSVFTAVATTTLEQTFALNFGLAALQPPLAAPWTITFEEPSPMGPNWVATGTVSLASPQTSPVTINLTYVVEPRAAMLTLPAEGVCPGNPNSFNPSPSVVRNAPLSVTIPAGRTDAPLSPQFESIGRPYNVQVIAWLYRTDLDGPSLLNPQAAYCLTIPE